MRTLLIDNYDSYTYNLFQLIATVNGEEPVVVRNDEVTADELDLSRFDNVVISPGPGRPDRPRDFGVCGPVIDRTDLPLLGVCLGHQGIVAHEGGRVVGAPEPRHGYLTKVTHHGGDLFRGLPPAFTAVRYHSLCAAEPLPAALEATAWAEDGVVMGLRHRNRPLWGVQFHPESVATEHGGQLLANFRDLTRAHQHALGRRPIATRPAPPTRRPTPAVAPTALRLLWREVGVEVDPEAAFAALYGESAHAFWLDSAHVEPGLARFSYLGDDRGPLAEYVSYRVRDGVVRRGDTEERVEGGILGYLSRELAARRLPDPGLPFDFTGGYVGYFGYELKADLGATPRHEADTPDACWLFADRLVAVDHEERRAYALAVTSAEDTADAERWLASTVQMLRRTRTGGSARTAPPTDAGPDVEPLLTRDRARYLDDVARSQRELHAGESYEICLTNAATVRTGMGGDRLYRALRRVNPAPYGAYLRLDGFEVACSSPERFLRVDRDRWVETKPIKGTAPRGGSAERDAQLRDELTGSAKTRAENLMIVDLLRNDLGRVCEVGSVHVPRLMATETYATVHQLVSTVRGRLRPDADALDCVRACFPGGSMTGAPKHRTMEIIDRLETEARGVYSGAIGFLSCNGTADLNIVIRTAVGRGDRWRVGAGGAIVLDSDPVEEYEEMLLKARATLRAVTTGRSG